MCCRSHIALALLSAVLVLCGRVLAAPPETDEPRSYGTSSDNTGNISAPVTYKDLMLVAVSPEGVAAIVFGDLIEHGRKYRFRYLPKGEDNEITGEGEVFERRKGNRYDGGKLTIRAGDIKIGWSLGGDESGWIYYEPEKLRVQIASADRFEDSRGIIDNRKFDKIDLKRFLKQP